MQSYFIRSKTKLDPFLADFKSGLNPNSSQRFSTLEEKICEYRPTLSSIF